jgi:hypothetical protein
MQRECHGYDGLDDNRAGADESRIIPAKLCIEPAASISSVSG